MIHKVFPLGLMLGAAAVVWAGSLAPRIGAVREPDGSVRPLFGLSSNFVVGEPLPLGPVLAAAFSDKAGLMLRNGRIDLVSPDGSLVASYATGEAKPIFDVADGPETAIAWLPSAGRFVRWNGRKFIDSAFDATRLAGSIRAIDLLDSGHVELLVSNGETLERVCVAIAEGVPVRSEILPETGEPAFQTDSFVLFHDASGLELRWPDGAMRTLPIPQTDLVFEKSGKDWLHISSPSAGRQWMLHLDARNPILSELPGAPAVKPAPTEAAK